VVADPIDGAYGPLFFVLFCPAELGGGRGELQFEQILAPAESSQLRGQLIRLAMGPGAPAQLLDGAEDRFDSGMQRANRFFDYHNFVSV